MTLRFETTVIGLPCWHSPKKQNVGYTELSWQAGERLRLAGYYQDQGYLFAQEDGSPLHPDSVTAWMKKAFKSPRLPPAPSPYAPPLRHVSLDFRRPGRDLHGEKTWPFPDFNDAGRICPPDPGYGAEIRRHSGRSVSETRLKVDFSGRVELLLNSSRYPKVNKIGNDKNPTEFIKKSVGFLHAMRDLPLRGINFDSLWVRETQIQRPPEREAAVFGTP